MTAGFPCRLMVKSATPDFVRKKRQSFPASGIIVLTTGFAGDYSDLCSNTSIKKCR